MSAATILAAQDAEDLEILSARLQDAVARVKDLVWLPRTHRFAALFNRFKWEEVEKSGAALRVRSGLSFDGVLSAKSQNIRGGDPDAVLSLLAVKYAPNSNEDPAGSVELFFSGGGVIRLEVECLDASLADLGGEWAARRRPAHPFAG